jgi:DNA repair photolyase
MPFEIYSEPARSILTRTSGFIAEAGFTHSLTPARNCTYGCSYCYVPTMGIYGGLRAEDVHHWGDQTTFKSNAPELLASALRPDQVIYCSPLVDPFQPAETLARAMWPILGILAARPPAIFVLQTRSAKILDYVEGLRALSKRTTLRVSFSITTDDDAIRRIYEPHCDPIERRFDVVQALVEHGIDTYVTLAPLLPCDPDHLLDRALHASRNPILCDPLHTRAEKPRGATTRSAALRISHHHGHSDWHDPEFQRFTVARMAERARAAGRDFATGPAAFRFLSTSSPI